MSRLSWGARGERYFETGVDRGVLYAPSQPGVAWTGLISVSESPSGGQAKPYYLDGLKYLNISAAEEFAATITAFSTPPEFGPCDGVVSAQNGLFVTGQRRVSFGMSYRTLVGNDIQRSDHAYKIHLVYNALAAPAQRSNDTLGESTEPSKFSWSITTLAPGITGYKPTAHLIVDSRYTDPEVLSAVEDILYGTEALAPSLPTPEELIDTFS